MKPAVRTQILRLTQSVDIACTELIQPLWNNYGTLCRVWLQGGPVSSVIVKHIQIPAGLSHPRGFASSVSRARKIRSYQVESVWYQKQNLDRPTSSPTPGCLGAVSESGELFLVLEDLSICGFQDVLSQASMVEIRLVLHWLAGFHAAYLDNPGEGLWPVGTYWHLATRPEELEEIRGTELHRFASFLDARLRCGGYPTLVHGDAKLANFLFTKDRDAVAAVDFQYVGCGSAMKDLAYFVGSCLSGRECERREEELLGIYFAALQECLAPEVNGAELEAEWRSLYPVAWADFQRFLLGWSPGHRKLSDYSDDTTRRAVDEIEKELRCAARTACLTAGQLLNDRQTEPLEVYSKGFESQAADALTQVDLEAQEAILECLKNTIQRYDLGVLAEEGESDDSRLVKHAFWAIDPLDGTRFYAEGAGGFAVSVALISQAGEVLLGVVYDPVDDRLFEAMRGKGVHLNGEVLPAQSLQSMDPESVRCFADRSLEETPGVEGLRKEADIEFAGGAVVNALNVLLDPGSVYIKAPKKTLGGGAVWDFAAVSLMLEEFGGSVQSYSGEPLHWNRENTVYFNDSGVVFLGSARDPENRFWERHLSPDLEGG